MSYGNFPRYSQGAQSPSYNPQNFNSQPQPQIPTYQTNSAFPNINQQGVGPFPNDINQQPNPMLQQNGNPFISTQPQLFQKSNSITGLEDQGQGIINNQPLLNQNQQPEENQVEQNLTLYDQFVSIQRSDYISGIDILTHQAKYLKPLETKGLMSTDVIKIDKSILFDQGSEQPIIRDKELNNFLMKKDGVFISSNDEIVSSFNIQRLEQRLMRENHKEWFKENGELIMANEIYDEKMTKFRDISLVRNPALNIVRKNAALWERVNQKKGQYYKLDIVIGKIRLTNHPLFSKEDELSTDLKLLIKEYRDRCDMTLIPYLSSKLELLSRGIQSLREMAEIPIKELQLLENELRDTQMLYEKEVEYMQGLMQKIYDTWTDIKNLRIKQKYNSSTTKLSVREYPIDNGRTEIDLFIGHLDLSRDSDYTGRPLPSNEKSRRNSVGKLRIYLKVIINGKEVSKTNSYAVNWPSFEVNILEKFQIYLFTKPSSIKFEVCIGSLIKDTVDVINLDIPGESAHTITSSSVIYREKIFQNHVKGTNLNSNTTNAPSAAQSPTGTGNQGQPQNQSSQGEDNKLIMEPTTSTYVKPRARIEGVIYYKAEWYGFGPKLPPPKIDNFGKEYIDKLNENAVKDFGLDKMFDLNDPRNYYLYLKLKEMKSEQLKELLKRDAMSPFSDIESLRLKLLRLRLSEPILAQYRIPLTCEEITSNKKLMNFLNDYFQRMKEIEEYGEIKTLNQLREIESEEKPPETPETRKRVTNIKLILNERAQLAKMEKITDNKAVLSLKAVVNEFYFTDQANPFKEFIESIFQRRGKLAPKKREINKVAHNKVKEVAVLIQIIKGSNIPVRTQSALLAARLQQQQYQKEFSKNGYPLGQMTNTQFMNPNLPMMNATGQMMNTNTHLMNQNPLMMNATGQMMNPSMMQAPGSMNRYNGVNYGGMPMPLDPNIYAGQSNYGRLPIDRRNLPEREFANDENARAILRATQKDSLLEVERVLSYVNVRLVSQGEVVQSEKTEDYEGVHPEWNDNLRIFVRSKNERGFDTEEIIDSEAVLYFGIFDHLGAMKNKVDNPNKYTMLIERRYLGSFKIPLVTLFSNPKQEATFKVERPLFLFGYYNPKASILSPEAIDEKSSITTNPFIPTYVSLSIGMDPTIEFPSKNEADYYPGGEDPQLLITGSKWLQDLRKNPTLAGRNIRLWGEDLRGVSIFIPRFFLPLQPPFDPIDEMSYQRAARYVSLIPFKNDSQQFKDLPDIWSTSQQFLDLRAGDYEEHAILLCNYFNYIDNHLNKPHIKSYIILGKGVPEGDTVYVLRRDTKTGDVEIWNSLYGEPYYIGFKNHITKFLCLVIGRATTLDAKNADPACPLKSVGCIANHENVWINIQNCALPGGISYELENSKFWMPFLGPKTFGKFFPTGKIETIQLPLIYEPINIDYAQKLEKNIQRYIATKIERIRLSNEGGKKPLNTKWNRKMSQNLRNILLTTFESFRYKIRVSGRKSPFDNQNKEYDQAMEELDKIKNEIISELTGGKEIYGFPLNMPYISAEKIWEEVKNTDIHNIIDNDVEYVLAIGVYPYPHFVMSVWVYIAVLFNPIYERN